MLRPTVAAAAGYGAVVIELNWAELLPAVQAEPAVLQAISDARDALADLHRHPANRRGWAKSAAAGSVRAARASAAIEGSVVDPLPEGRVQDPILAGALRACSEVASCVPVWERSPLQALARLHTLIAAGLVRTDELGRPIRSAERVAAISGWARSRSHPAPIIVAAVHLELLSANAFAAGNGVLARSAARVVSIACGLDPHGLGVPEVAQWRAGSGYSDFPVELARSAQESTEALAGTVARWCRLSCGWLIDGAREGRSIADALPPG